MKVQSNQQTSPKSRRGLLALMGVLLASSLLTGCSRPGDENVEKMVNDAYACKYIEIAEFNKFDQMSGIYSYVAQYTFKVRFKDGEKGAQTFFKGLLAEMEMKGDNWEEWIQTDKVQEYLGDECSEAGQIALERMVEVALPQIQEKKKEIRLPSTMPMIGWAEFMPGKRGWDITVRRDKVSADAELGAPIKRETLLAKAPAKKGKKAPKK